ncbi:MAG: DUF1467 family protein [Parvibaculaceae bacterium]|nr:DUF1467 family protein [Parvibaculaceae bacterium]
MSFGAGMAIYVIFWWLTLFAVLPFGVKPHQDAAAYNAGTRGSAPENPHMKAKLLTTTGISLVIFAAFYWTVVHSGLTLADVPFFPTFNER